MWVTFVMTKYHIPVGTEIYRRYLYDGTTLSRPFITEVAVTYTEDDMWDSLSNTAYEFTLPDEAIPFTSIWVLHKNVEMLND